MRKTWPLSSREFITERQRWIGEQVAALLEMNPEPRGGGGRGITRKEVCCRDAEGSLGERVGAYGGLRIRRV